jgi:hypothetical protein
VRSDGPPEPLLPLLAPARYLTGAAVAAIALAGACLAHAAVTSHEANDPALGLARRLALSDLALMPRDDLRHPGWGRPEQGRSGQPGLPDPRGPLLPPVPMKVTP